MDRDHGAGALSGSPFYERLNKILAEAHFDAFVEKLCGPFYAERGGRPSVPPGIYVRMLLVGYFEGLHSEREIDWRCADSLSLRASSATTSRRRRPTTRRCAGPARGSTSRRTARSSPSSLAHKVEHAVDMDTGAVMAVTIQPGARGDTQSFTETLTEVLESTRAGGRRADQQSFGEAGSARTVGDKGYHSNATMALSKVAGCRSYISEPERPRRDWQDKECFRRATYANRRRIKGERGKALLRRRGELLERTFAHTLETGGMRRARLRMRDNILKRYLVHIAAFNLSLVMRAILGVGTPRELRGRLAAACAALHEALLRLLDDVCLMLVVGTPPPTVRGLWSSTRPKRALATGC